MQRYGKRTMTARVQLKKRIAGLGASRGLLEDEPIGGKPPVVK
jgi:hypothetical protein